MNNLQARLSARGTFFASRGINAALVAALHSPVSTAEVPTNLNVVRTVTHTLSASSQTTAAQSVAK